MVHILRWSGKPHWVRNVVHDSVIRLGGWSVPGQPTATGDGLRKDVIFGIPTAERRYALPLAGMIGSVALGADGSSLLRTIADFPGAVAEKTSSPTDDILVSFKLAVARVVVGVALAIATALSVSTTDILAGLEIGGLAFAFASHETLSNMFGAGIHLTDRPFRRGDWIKAGEVESSVEAVGIRSTRVRTAQCCHGTERQAVGFHNRQPRHPATPALCACS